MKQGSSLKNFILLVIAVAVVLFAYVATYSEIKRIMKEKISKQDLLNVKLNAMEDKLVDVQRLTTEDRIVRFAQDSLGMIRPKENLDTIFVSKDQINQIEKLLKEKYD